jgi:hypothetical protein
MKTDSLIRSAIGIGNSIAGKMDAIQLTLELKDSIGGISTCPRSETQNTADAIFDLLCGEREDLRVKVVHESTRCEYSRLFFSALPSGGINNGVTVNTPPVSDVYKINGIPVFQC